MTPTEKLVSDLCKGTFLSFWSFPNPIGKRLDKELCDILVVCDPDIIIFSVKEINVKDSGDFDLDVQRWERNAIEESVSQLYGAERIINQKEEILLSDKNTKIKLPEKGIRNIYRVAVAFGRGEKFPLKFGEFGKGFVHVFDERSIKIILQELDTITDFISFLDAKEKFVKRGINHISFSGEDYLGMYLQNGFDIEEGVDLLIMDSEIWEGYSKSEEYTREKNANKISYIWDGIIERLCEDFKDDNLIDKVKREELELALRLMNKETRFGRRQMSSLLMDMLDAGVDKPKVKARIVSSERDNAPLYVVMTRPHDDREFARKELYLRCHVAKSLFPERKQIIGLGTDPYVKGKGHSLDLIYQDLTIWRTEDQKNAEQMTKELGYFKSAQQSRLKPDGNRVLE